MSTKTRYGVAALIGVLLHAVYMWKFLPYSIRERRDGLLPLWTLFALTFLVGFALSYGMEEHRFRAPAALFYGFAGANILLIVADCWHDPTNHNLWPFEFVIIGIFTAPAFLGAWIGARFQRNSAQG